MKAKYKAIPMYDRSTAEFLYYYLLVLSQGKMVGIAENGKPIEFKTRPEARDFAIELFASGNPIISP
jgi:hypothetical protein